MEHHYEVAVEWTGDRGAGTSDPRGYGRQHEVRAAGLPVLPGTADPTFRGDRDRWNPEQLLLAALAQCHMLSYLYLCATGGVVVTGYTDQAVGRMVTTGDSGRFVDALLRPTVTVAAAAMVDRARALHADAHRACFIANSVNFPVRHEPLVRAGGTPPARPDRPAG